MNQMYALVKTKADRGLELQRVPIPQMADDEVMIKIRKTAICGTDMSIYKWTPWAAQHVKPPMHIGHEYIGEIVAVGKLVDAYHVGQRVSGEGHIVCGTCRNCRAGQRHLCRNTKGVGVERPGAFAEYLVIPRANVVPVPDEIPDEIAAIFDPLGNAVHTALTYDLIGEDVLITGAGPIGIMATAIARHVGARHIVISDYNEYRLNLAKEITPDVHCVNLNNTTLDEEIQALGMGEGFDVAMEMSGAPQAMQEIVNNMRNGGKIAMLGIMPPESTIDWNQVIFKGLNIQGIYGRKMFETWYKMIAMVQSGLDVSKLITHRVDFRNFREGFEAMGSGQSGKVIIDWTTVGDE